MENLEVIQFLWDRDKGGYEWTDIPENHSLKDNPLAVMWLKAPSGSGPGSSFNSGIDSKRGPFLNPCSFEIEYYQPFEDPGLFKLFANVEPTKDGVIAFAEKYGQIGPDNSLLTWTEQIQAMRSAADLWDLVQRRDIVQLAFLIRWDSHAINLETDRGDVLIAGEDSMERFKRPDPVRPALFHLQRIINRQLEGQTSPKLLWPADYSRLHLHIIPTTLIGGLWLQFARAIEGDIGYRACEAGCGRWIALQSGSARIDKRTCTPACRTALWRKQKLAQGRKPVTRKAAARADGRKLSNQPSKTGVDLGVELSSKATKKHGKARKG